MRARERERKKKKRGWEKKKEVKRDSRMLVHQGQRLNTVKLFPDI